MRRIQLWHFWLAVWLVRLLVPPTKYAVVAKACYLHEQRHAPAELHEINALVQQIEPEQVHRLLQFVKKVAWHKGGHWIPRAAFVPDAVATANAMAQAREILGE